MAFVLIMTTRGKNFQKANAQSCFNAKRPQTYDDRYSRENKLRENEQIFIRFHDQEQANQ